MIRAGAGSRGADKEVSVLRAVRGLNRMAYHDLCDLGVEVAQRRLHEVSVVGHLGGCVCGCSAKCNLSKYIKYILTVLVPDVGDRRLGWNAGRSLAGNS